MLFERRLPARATAGLALRPLELELFHLNCCKPVSSYDKVPVPYDPRPSVNLLGQNLPLTFLSILRNGAESLSLFQRYDG